MSVSVGMEKQPRRSVVRVATVGVSSALLLTASMASCVTQDVKDKPGEVSSAVASSSVDDPNKTLAAIALNEKGLMPALVSRIIDPVTIVVNPKNPRTVRLAGIEAASAKDFPEAAEQGKAWAFKFLGKGQVIYVRPLPAINLQDPNQTIVGAVLLPATDANKPEDDTVKGFVDAAQGLLSQGLAKIKDIGEFDSPDVMRAAYAKQEYAQQKKVGMWKK